MDEKSKNNMFNIQGIGHQSVFESQGNEIHSLNDLCTFASRRPLATHILDSEIGGFDAHPSKNPRILKSSRTEACPGVKISPDGMHWCVETFGGRFTASIACLLGCVYNVARPPTDEEIRKCEQRCNDQFMSLNVVRDEMFKN
eukprot:scaffold9463_cov136-Skeletonema_dohrnii-CCMP3373.AAC.1